MRISRLIPAIALVSAFLVYSAPTAWAQAEATAEAKTEAVSAQARTEVNYESLLAAMGDVVGRVKDYNAVKGKKADQIQVVDVAKLMPADQATYDEARTKYTNFIQYLQGVTGKVALLSKALTDAKVEPASVVALDVLKDGKVVVFYDTRAAASTQDTTQSSGAPQQQSSN